VPNLELSITIFVSPATQAPSCISPHHKHKHTTPSPSTVHLSCILILQTTGNKSALELSPPTLANQTLTPEPYIHPRPPNHHRPMYHPLPQATTPKPLAAHRGPHTLTLHMHLSCAILLLR
jgi:hypothetical protein